MGRIIASRLLPAALLLHFLAAQAPGQRTLSAALLRDVRADLVGDRFGAALETMSGIPADAANDPETLTLRGISRWGLALQRSSALTTGITELGLVRRAYRSLLASKQRHTDKAWDVRVDSGRTAMAGDVARCIREGRDLPQRCKEVDDLLTRAERDFHAAAGLRPGSGAPWCAVPGCWELLVKVHRLLLLQDRAEWATPYDAARAEAADGLDVPIPVPSAADLRHLEDDVSATMARLLEGGDASASPATVARCVADALILTAVSRHRADAWLHESRMSRLSARDTASSVPPASQKPSAIRRLSDAMDELRGDPVHASVALYAFAAGRASPPGGTDASYSAFAISLPQMPALALDLLRSIPPRGELAAAVHLDSARTAAAQGRQVEAMEEVLHACQSARLKRPVLAAAPAPVRRAFLKSSAMLIEQLGPDVGAGYEQVCRLLEDAAKAAPSADLQARYEVIRLRLAELLTTGDLPWDRELGYQEAGAALRHLGRLAADLTDSQRAAFAATEARMQSAAVRETFPPAAFAIVSGQPVWLRNPFTDSATVLSNPLIVVSQGGAMVMATPDRTAP